MNPPSLFAALVPLLLLPCRALADEPATRPNIVLILADDLGYGDVQCLNPQRGKIATPNIDALAARGMTFTDAHSSSSVCTPTRYGLLTGRYNWRTRLQSSVLFGYDSPLIAADRLTLPKLLKQQGYTTACIGKWHLGLDLPEGESQPVIRNGPTTRGFDHFFGISASLDMPPFAYIENDRFTQPLTTTKKWVRDGPAAADFEARDVLPTLARHAVNYIEEQAKAKMPFFLYLPLTSPHTPIEPTAEWSGKSSLGDYGDFVMATDGVVGNVVEALGRAGIQDQTLLIVTADNGFSPAANLGSLLKHGHHPSGPLRGTKADIFEGGHRVPFMVRWPGRINPGTTTNTTICLNDVMATCAEIVGATLPENAGEDSVSFLPALIGKHPQVSREAVVHHSIEGNFAIRIGKWKLILASHSGGWSSPGRASKEATELPPNQLYDLESDPAETRNVQAEHPEIVAQFTQQLETIIAKGRSTPGGEQRNDVPVLMRKD
jgi:arylsulfatase A